MKSYVIYQLVPFLTTFGVATNPGFKVMVLFKGEYLITMHCRDKDTKVR